MPKNKKEIIKSIILSFIARMDTKKLQGLPLTQEERHWLSQKNGLEDYVYQQKDPRILPPEANESRNKLESTDERILEISKGTIYKAITEMVDEGIIENKDGYFRQKRTDGEPYASHPILKIASDLPITHLPIDDFVIFHVPERYADEIAHYLNSQFFCNDIYTVAVSGLIICLDIKFPDNSEYITKKSPVEIRVKEALKVFNLVNRSDKNIESGYTQQEVNKMIAAEEADRLLQQFKDQVKQPDPHGGTILKRPIRKIKRKKTTQKPH